MTTLTDIFSLDALDAALWDGYVRRQFHPDVPTLAILNYAEKAQFEQHWDEVTSACRGLIYDTETLDVIARPFPKFHNWDQGGQPYPPSGPVMVMDKMDGSLGIMYLSSKAEGIATRGSFASDQAKHATALFNKFYGEDWNVGHPLVNHTYLFEIIYPENRIVVNYGEDDKLVLLDVIDNATGLSNITEFDIFMWPWKVNRRLEPRGFYPLMLDDETLEGDEGIVLLWPATGYRVKMKRADYIELHRIVTGLDERKVWKAVCDGVSIPKFCEPLPDEFHQWVKDVAMRITMAGLTVLAEATGLHMKTQHELPEGYTRKDFALAVKKYGKPMTGYLFALEDERDIKPAIFESLRPEGNQYAKPTSEDTA